MITLKETVAYIESFSVYKNSGTRKSIIMEKHEECFICKSHIGSGGLPVKSIKNKQVYLNRFLYEHLIGKIPLGMTVRQHCGNKTCLNPSHFTLIASGITTGQNGRKKEIKWIREGDCHICVSHTDKHHEYPRICVNGKPMNMSNYIYRLNKGKIPDGHIIRHTCDNPPCINPDHLISGTMKDNSMDMVKRGRSTKGTRLINGKRVKV